MREKLRSLAGRAGLGPLPTPVLVAALAICLACAAWGFARWGSAEAAISAPKQTALPGASREGSSATTADTTLASHVPSPALDPPSMHVVHVVGAVMRPGVYEVEEGARVAEVVALAGGLTGSAEERAVNLARLVVDGEQLLVPTQDEWTERVAPAPAAAAPAGSSAEPDPPRVPAGPINVNTADAPALETLPGIGPVTAAHIIADREANGPFASVEELLRVSGIGDVRLEAIRDLVSVR